MDCHNRPNGGKAPSRWLAVLFAPVGIAANDNSKAGRGVGLDLTLAEAAEPIHRECRMVRNLVVEIELGAGTKRGAVIGDARRLPRW
jgi:hypothetical protein